MAISLSQYDKMVSMDINHVELIASLIKSQKSRSILELGYGSGLCTRAIVSAIEYNSIPVNYAVVDNWFDTEGTQLVNPENLSRYIKFYKLSEQNFVLNCVTKYDFVLSDADHYNSNKWFDRVYNELLSVDGIFVCHDVTNKDFKNLFDIYKVCVKYKIPHMLFNKSTLASERCERGLLVIYKTAGVAPVSLPEGVMKETV